MRETIVEIMRGVSYVGKPRKVANNTVRYETADGREVVRLHHTDIITKLPETGCYVLNSGGWRTPTTKERLNRFAPVRLWVRRGSWLLAEDVPFHDGIVIGPNGELPPADRSAELAEQKLRREINAFVKRLDKLEALPEPGPGDCWVCSMFQREPEHGQRGPFSAVEVSGPGNDTEHLRSHIAEGYLHGSLILNAIRWAGYRDPGFIWAMENADRKAGRKPDFARRALRRYLLRKLSLG